MSRRAKKNPEIRVANIGFLPGIAVLVVIKFNSSR